MFRSIVGTLIICTLFFSSCKKDTTTAAKPPADTTTTTQQVIYDNDNLLMGNPSNASQQDDDNYLLQKPAYAVSYNKDKGIPNWVSWHLYAPDLGAVSRQDDFLPDISLPSSWYQVTSESYNGSGFDRGHDCPSGDRTSSTTINSYTFLMTNIIPQSPVMNQGIWADMENYIRNLTAQGYEAYIIMGNYGSGGYGNDGYATTIDNGHVTVPASIWKVAVILPNGNGDTLRVDAGTRVIAVQIPNTNTLSGDWKYYRTSVDAIESATGLNLLSRLPIAVQNVIEAKVDDQ